MRATRAFNGSSVFTLQHDTNVMMGELKYLLFVRKKKELVFPRMKILQNILQ